MSKRLVSESRIREVEGLFEEAYGSLLSHSEEVEIKRSTGFRWAQTKYCEEKREFEKETLKKVETLLDDLTLDWMRFLEKPKSRGLKDRKFIAFLMKNVDKVFQLEKVHYKTPLKDVVRTMDLFSQYCVTLKLSKSKKNAVIDCVDGFFEYVKEHYEILRG